MTEQTDTPDAPNAGDRVHVAFDATYYGTSVGQPNAAVVIGVDTPIDNARLRDRFVVPASAVTPPVAGETTDAALLRLIRIAFGDPGSIVPRAEALIADPATGTGYESVSNWSARAVLASVLPHLTAERDAETAALRAENEKLAELWHEVVHTPHDGGEAQIWLRRWMTSGSSIADDPAEYSDAWFIGVEQVHEVIRAYLVANNLPVPAAVLADPAPSTPAAQEAQT